MQMTVLGPSHSLDPLVSNLITPSHKMHNYTSDNPTQAITRRGEVQLTAAEPCTGAYVK
jgi:hypothetical protein